MVELTLFCLIVGGNGNAFSVDISGEKSVDHLKDEIKKKDPDTITCAANKLALYIAKENGDRNGKEWMKKADPDKKKLINGDEDVLTKYVKDDMLMDPEDGLDDYFGDHAPKKGEIHVLVKVPERAALATLNNEIMLKFDETKDTLLNEIGTLKDTMKNMMQKDERKTVSISQIKSEKGNLLKNLVDVKFEKNQFKSDIKITGYEWTRGRNESNEEERQGYMEYLMQHLNKYFEDNKLHLTDLHGKNDLLNINDKRLPFNLRGTADLCIGDESEKLYGSFNFVGMRLIIEIKKNITDNVAQKEYQALAQLLASNIKSTDDPIPVLLTDLNENWRFFILCEKDGKKCVYRVNCVDPGTGLEVLKQVAQPDVEKIQIKDTTSRPFKKLKYNDIVPPIDEGETEAFERMRDVWDMLSPDEQFIEKLKYGDSLFRSSIPVYRDVPPIYEGMYA